jgi:hypothetical protein
VFADLTAPDEQLGTVPAQDRPPILLTEAELGDFIDAHYHEPGDQLFRMERLPWYDVPSQNADREAWLAGRFDPAQVMAWATRLAAERARGMISQRLRVIGASVTDDEAMSLHAALIISATRRCGSCGTASTRSWTVDHDYRVRPAAVGCSDRDALHRRWGVLAPR